MSGSRKFGPKKVCVPNIFWSKNICFQRFISPKILVVQNSFFVTEDYDQKTCMVQKKMGW